MRASTIIEIRIFSPNQCICWRNDRELAAAIRSKPKRLTKRLGAALRRLEAHIGANRDDVVEIAAVIEKTG